MNAHPGLPIDSAQLARFLDGVFRYADEDTFLSARAFFDDQSQVFAVQGLKVGADLATLLPALEGLAARCTHPARPVVFAPPLASFRSADKATEADLANGLALSVACDKAPTAARVFLEALLGPATFVVRSGGECEDVDTGEIEKKLHLHWRLSEPTRTPDDHRLLKQGRVLATRLVGGDASNQPVVHPLRWPGSWHRKGAPRLAEIVSDTDSEIDLGDALERLQEACDAAGVRGSPPSNTSNRANDGTGEARDTAELVSAVLTATDYHAALTTLAMRYLKGDMGDAQVVLTLRGFMQAIPAAERDMKDGVAQPGRWQSRYDDIPRAVSTARAKIGPVDPPSDLPPSMAVLHRTQIIAPAFPAHVLGPWWASWLETAAAGANAPSDYVALPLLATASALIGNARWARAWQGWVEPPVLWCASVGNPSSGKSPGASAVTRDVLRLVEANMARDYSAEAEAWKEADAVAKAVYKQWEKDVADTVKKKGRPPPLPLDAISPPKPIRPRARVADATVEALAVILQGLPKGVLHARDELAGWLLNLSRYSGGTDRPFWLEAYVGGAMQVDRLKNPEPLFIPHLSVPVFGTIQPERLSDVLEKADDGLGSRFLWSWPEPRAFARPDCQSDVAGAVEALGRLAELGMASDEHGKPMPSYVSLTPSAAALLETFARETQQQENSTGGLLKSALGKARGQALRLSIVIEYLTWSTSNGLEPTGISERSMAGALELMTSYFLPMARRVLGDASIPVEERNARTLAQFIVRTRPAKVNVSAIRDDARLDGLRESELVKAACSYLVEARWLSEPPHTGRGRPRGDYLVNPGLWPAIT